MDVFKPGQTFRYASLKRDGHFTQLDMIDGHVAVYSRSGKDITHKVTWTPWFQAAQAKAAKDPATRTFFGEMWLPGGMCTDVPHAQCVHDPRLLFQVFGCAHLEEGARLEEVQDDAHDCGLTVIDFWPFAQKETTQEHWRRTADVEGFVYSDGNCLNMAKEKPMRSADLIITGWTEGEGKYAGLIGALKVSTCDGEELASVSGMTDELRRLISSSPESFLGRVCEVQYQSVAKLGRLRHPVFLGFRDDKRPEECGINQIK